MCGFNKKTVLGAVSPRSARRGSHARPCGELCHSYFSESAKCLQDVPRGVTMIGILIASQELHRTAWPARSARRRFGWENMMSGRHRHQCTTMRIPSHLRHHQCSRHHPQAQSHRGMSSLHRHRHLHQCLRLASHCLPSLNHLQHHRLRCHLGCHRWTRGRSHPHRRHSHPDF